MTQTQQDKIEQASEKLKNYPLRYLVVGFKYDENKNECVFDSSVVCSEKQLMDAMKRYYQTRIFNLNEM